MTSQKPPIDYAGSQPSEDPKRRRRRKESFQLLIMALMAGAASIACLVIARTRINALDDFLIGQLVMILAGFALVFGLASFERYWDSRRF